MKQTILYIDDEVENLTVFKATFRHDYNVMTAESSKAGLYLLRQTPISVVIPITRCPRRTASIF